MMHPCHLSMNVVCTHLSEGHGDDCGHVGGGLGAGVVLQHDAVALEDHIRLALDGR